MASRFAAARCRSVGAAQPSPPHLLGCHDAAMPPRTPAQNLDRIAQVIMSVSERHDVTNLRHFPGGDGVLVTTVAPGVDLEVLEALLPDVLGIDVEVMPDTLDEVVAVAAHLGRPLGEGPSVS